MPKPKAPPNPDREALALAIRIGKRLREAREAQGLTRAAAARLAKMERHTLLRAEAGDPGITLRTLVRLCRSLSLDAREIVGRE